MTNWARLNPNIRRRYSGTDLCGLLARLVRFCCPLLELYFLYRALQAAFELQEAGESFAVQEDAIELTPHTVQHLQRLQEEQELSAEQRKRLLLAMSAVMQRLTNAAQCYEAFQRVPRWGVVLAALLQPEEDEEITCSFLKLCLQLGTKANA